MESPLSGATSCQVDLDSNGSLAHGIAVPRGLFFL